MKFLKKLKSGNFWVSIISAGVLIAEGVFNFEIQTEYLNQILLGLMGLLTLFGIVADHGDKEAILTTSASLKDKDVQNDNSKKDENISSVKSICDTISLLVNKVSISTKEDEREESKIQGVKGDKMNFEDIENVKEKEISTEKAVDISKDENLINTETQNEEIIKNEMENKDVLSSIKTETVATDEKENNELTTNEEINIIN